MKQYEGLLHCNLSLPVSCPNFAFRAVVFVPVRLKDVCPLGGVLNQ